MDAINAFDASTQDASAFGLEQPIKGDGYALTHDSATSKWRADVWDSEQHRACPYRGTNMSLWVQLAGAKLTSDFPSELGHSRAVALRDAMVAMYV